MGKVKELKKQCCKKYLKKGKMCSRCPFLEKERASGKKCEKLKKKERKKKKKKGNQK